MLQTLVNPLSAATFIALAFSMLVGFIISQVLATVPSSSFEVLHYRAPGVAIKEEYTGIISWVTEHVLRVIDTKGVAHELAIDGKTAILKNESPQIPERYSDLRVMQHVRISAIKDETNERAEVILVQ